jgi:hypothetical protein
MCYLVRPGLQIPVPLQLVTLWLSNCCAYLWMLSLWWLFPSPRRSFRIWAMLSKISCLAFSAFSAFSFSALAAKLAVFSLASAFSRAASCSAFAFAFWSLISRLSLSGLFAMVCDFCFGLPN